MAKVSGPIRAPLAGAHLPSANGQGGGWQAGGGRTFLPPPRPLPLEAVSLTPGLRPLVTNSTQPVCG